MGWQWHQLDHMQIIYTSLQTDNHAITSLLSFHRCPSCHPTNSAKALKANANIPCMKTSNFLYLFQWMSVSLGFLPPLVPEENLLRITGMYFLWAGCHSCVLTLSKHWIEIMKLCRKKCAYMVRPRFVCGIRCRPVLTVLLLLFLWRRQWCWVWCCATFRLW